MEIVEPLGHEVIVYGYAGDVTLVAKLDPHRAPDVGSTVTLMLDTSAFHLFDPGTGERIL